MRGGGVGGGEDWRLQGIEPDLEGDAWLVAGAGSRAAAAAAAAEVDDCGGGACDVMTEEIAAAGGGGGDAWSAEATAKYLNARVG